MITSSVIAISTSNLFADAYFSVITSSTYSCFLYLHYYDNLFYLPLGISLDLGPSIPLVLVDIITFAIDIPQWLHFPLTKLIYSKCSINLLMTLFSVLLQHHFLYISNILCFLVQNKNIMSLQPSLFYIKVFTIFVCMCIIFPFYHFYL